MLPGGCHIRVLEGLQRVGIEHVQAHGASGSSSTCRRYSSTDRFQSSIHGSPLNMPANSSHGCDGGPISSPTTSVPFFSRVWIFARNFSSASSRVEPLALTANGSVLRA